MKTWRRSVVEILAVVTVGLLNGPSAHATDAFLKEAMVGDIAVGIDSVGVNVNEVTGCNANGSPNSSGLYVRFKLAGPEAKTWFALLLVAKETKKKIQVWYDPALMCQLTAIRLL